MAAADCINNSSIAAGIDIGSNTFRLLIARVVGERLTTLVKELATVRLSRKVTTNRILAPDAVERALSVLQHFNAILDQWQPQYIRACGTAALRTADNSNDFLSLAQQTLGVEIEIITGSEEARLSLVGTMAFMEQQGPGPVLLVDVGGGSTELACAAEGGGADSGGEYPAPKVASLMLGVVSLTEKFLHRPITTPEEIINMTDHIRKHLSAALEKLTPCLHRSLPMIIGTGGSATSMAALALDLESYDEQKVQGHTLTRSRLAGLWQRLVTFTAAERNLLPGLQDGRGEILLAGIRIYQVLLELLNAQRLTISDAGLLEGILLSRLK